MDILLLFFAGVFGGVLNSIAGGGSFITFPALMAVGVPPVIANATNTFASCAGYLSGAWGFRHELSRHRDVLPRTIIVSLMGGVLGAVLLLTTEENDFLTAIPWLLLFATLLFIFGPNINRRLAQGSHAKKSSLTRQILPAAFLLLVSAYGGFFNAGLGIVALGYLSLCGYHDIHLMNGLKLLISSCVSLVAVAIFIWHGSIDWLNGIAVLVGSLAGGYISAMASKYIARIWIQRFVALSSLLITGYFFIDVYA
ncbi:permease [Vibrio navarrensis]|uniref:sulfite exporter TauE/SafE family protein n=1 Tax=Vibrio navarrensis TaxID=29495 RepID=UPI00192FA8D4|nr:sulfite exporter TauE/SafE family protein [Vibrio navarrensis]MBE3667724.1 permease [Vibrio navarrensis]